VKYRRTGYDTGWYLPDVLLKDLEHPDEGAKRVSTDQLGVKGLNISLSHIESFKADGIWHLAFHYKAELEPLAKVDSVHEIAEIRWFPLSQLPERNAVGLNGWALATIKQILEKLQPSWSSSANTE
jgi:ADP-ribose pyrophosphatase YjhB (NUDIX family)